MRKPKRLLKDYKGFIYYENTLEFFFDGLNSFSNSSRQNQCLVRKATERVTTYLGQYIEKPDRWLLIIIMLINLVECKPYFLAY